MLVDMAKKKKKRVHLVIPKQPSERSQRRNVLEGTSALKVWKFFAWLFFIRRPRFYQNVIKLEATVKQRNCRQQVRRQCGLKYTDATLVRAYCLLYKNSCIEITKSSLDIDILVSSSTVKKIVKCNSNMQSRSRAAHYVLNFCQ